MRNNLARSRGEADFSHEVYDATAGCLACKSCAGQCPVKVNVPEFRSRFLELYHGRYQRPLRDYLIGSLEFTLFDALPENPHTATETFRLLAHCTEKTNVPASTAQWETLFARLGLKLVTEATGCCGMSGTFGHEARNQDTSRTIFEQSWAGKLDKQGEALATGYSCRSQVKRLADRQLRHPLEVVLEHVRAK